MKPSRPAGVYLFQQPLESGSQTGAGDSAGGDHVTRSGRACAQRVGARPEVVAKVGLVADDE